MLEDGKNFEDRKAFISILHLFMPKAHISSGKSMELLTCILTDDLHGH